MITRAVVESIEDAYHVKVRVPTLNRSSISNVYTDTDSLNLATICTLTQYDPNLQVGDVVFVGFEDRDLSTPVVLGYLYRNEKTQTYADQILGTLEVLQQVKLPYDTQIGAVSYTNIRSLTGCDFQIKLAIENLQQQVEELQKQLQQLTGEDDT